VTPTDGQYTLDRWRYGASAASKVSIQQSSDAPAGFANSLLVTSLSAYSVSASDAFNLQQPIEGFNASDLSWGTANAQSVTLSFWARSSLTGSFGGVFLNDAFNRSYAFSYSINSANTWEQKTITIEGDTSGTWLKTNSVGVRVIFSLGSGADNQLTPDTWSSTFGVTSTGATNLVATNGATFYITGVQLEAGTVATPFEHRSFGQELALCQRYLPSTFLRTANNPIATVQALSNTVGIAFIPWNVTPRVPPTGISASAASGFYVTNTVASAGFNASALAFEISSNLAGIIRVTHASNAASAGNMVGFNSNTSGATILWTGCEL
jgi:hypothetical protein